MKKLIIKYPLLILIVLAVILRLPLLNGSFWLDEAAQALEIIRPLNQQFNIANDFQPPLLHIILHFAQYISRSEWFLRSVGSLIPSILTIIYTYKIAEKLFSKRDAIIACSLLATSSFHIFYSQELRPYSLPTALAIMSMYHFILVSKESISISVLKKNNNNWIYLTLYNILGLYTSYLYPFFILAQIAYTISNWSNRNKKVLLSFLFSILAFIPFLPVFLQQLAQGNMVRQNLPGWDQVVSSNQLKAIPLVFGKLLFGVLPLDINPLMVFLFTILGISLVGTTVHLLKNYQKFDFKILIFWLAVPISTAWLMSFFIPIISPKRLLFMLPALYLIIAHVSTMTLENSFKNGLKKINLREKSILMLLTSILIINFTGIFAYYVSAKLQRENWRGLQQLLHRQFEPKNTLLVYSFPNEFAPMAWYELNEESTFPTFSTGVLYIENTKDLANEIKIAVNYQTVIVFDYLRNLTDPNREIERKLMELGFKEVGVLDYPNIGFIRVFVQPLTVIGSK